MGYEEILRYIFSCVSYKHMFDLSPRITDSAQKKEDLLFNSAVYFLRELYKNKNITVEDIKKESTMKEITYEEWQKNPTPRMMWVWDNKIDDKEKKKVVYIVGKNSSFPVITVEQNGGVVYFKHCAEIEEPKTRIEEPKTRRMTNKELARWLKEKPTGEFKYNNCDDNCIHSYLYYYESNADKEVDESVVIREDDSDWREPIVEVEEWFLRK